MSGENSILGTLTSQPNVAQKMENNVQTNGAIKSQSFREMLAHINTKQN